MSDLSRALDALHRLHPRIIDLGLSRIERVLAALDNPQDRLPPTLHVAGTNGKGSTVALLRAIAEAHGLRVHVYTSPHLVRFNERITLASNPVSDDALVDSIARIRRANADRPLSFFEATTAVAYDLFARTPADLCIVEVGLGGRFDATNVITPSLSIITPIDLDHAEYLGRDIRKVASEKAGIIKPGAPVFVGPQRPEIASYLHAEAQIKGTEAHIFGRDFRAYRQQGALVFEADSLVLDLAEPALAGEHQIANAGLAVAAARALKLDDAGAISAGLRAVRWPARMQSLTTGIFADMVSESGGELWLDGGHNPHAARALAAHMASLEARHARPLVLVMGILANKDAGGFLDQFEGLASGLCALSIPGHTSLAPETLAELARNRGITPTIASNLTDAVARAINMGEALSRETTDIPITPPRILICGSLYLAGEVLKQSEV